MTNYRKANVPGKKPTSVQKNTWKPAWRLLKAIQSAKEMLLLKIVISDNDPETQSSHVVFSVRFGFGCVGYLRITNKYEHQTC